jgi:4-hydroxythreonine-4-phosphate dehydrogenase
MKPILAITMGDFNGIGPEVVLKAVLSPAVRRICSPLLVGSIDVFALVAHQLRLRINLKEVDTISHSRESNVAPVFNIRRFHKPTVRPGRMLKEAGDFAGDAIEIAAKLCLQGIAHGMVTAPVSKQALNAAGFRFEGQTQMLAKLCRCDSVLMMLIADQFRVGLATIHTPIKKVPNELSTNLLVEKLRVVNRSLKHDFGIRNPAIAVLGLNPHAGENGLLGREEGTIIQPAIRFARRRKMNITGPFPADGFFGSTAYKSFDAVLAMYHDQGLIPLKMQGFNIGVNFSAGLPIVRTSPDHGTAFDIAGKGIADPTSTIKAIELAAAIIRNRNKRTSR